ncbi:hypothetical protein [Dyadobacter sp. Leaf189]|uniref:hypothetical protein n=1 Tax=Dyadobacter sp. TaxID=1914288 RepID=UPI0006F63DBB|nr:hypothetical protein ASG33_14690 [Dyadobacter sp. Leaf189]
MEMKWPENGTLVRFRRHDEEEWREGEFDEQNQMFVEIYAPELITHNTNDIAEWVQADFD